MTADPSILSSRFALGAFVSILACASAAAAPQSIIVSADGSGLFKTVQAAIDSLPKENSNPVVIRLKPGIYNEHVSIAKGRNRITFAGEDAATTKIVDKRPANFGGGTYESATVAVYADDFSAENVIFENAYGQGTQALAVAIRGRRIQFRNCRFIGWQDTVRIDNGPMYFANCQIEGHCDYIYGTATAWFERCTIRSKANGYITAASTPKEVPFGYVFNHCELTASPGCTRVFLGRPWRDYAAVIWLNTVMGKHILPEGWNNWRAPQKEKTARYREYNSSGPGGDMSRRAKWPGIRILPKDEATPITLKTVLGDWKPGFLLKKR